MSTTILEELTTAGAVSWLRERGMIVKQTSGDPETFIPVQGYILSDELRDLIDET